MIATAEAAAEPEGAGSGMTSIRQYDMVPPLLPRQQRRAGNSWSWARHGAATRAPARAAGTIAARTARVLAARCAPAAPCTQAALALSVAPAAAHRHAPYCRRRVRIIPRSNALPRWTWTAAAAAARTCRRNPSRPHPLSNLHASRTPPQAGAVPTRRCPPPLRGRRWQHRCCRLAGLCRKAAQGAVPSPPAPGRGLERGRARPSPGIREWGRLSAPSLLRLMLLIEQSTLYSDICIFLRDPDLTHTPIPPLPYRPDPAYLRLCAPLSPLQAGPCGHVGASLGQAAVPDGCARLSLTDRLGLATSQRR